MTRTRAVLAALGLTLVACPKRDTAKPDTDPDPAAEPAESGTGEPEAKT